MNDIEAANELIKKWYQARQWAEAFLCASLKLENANDILRSEHRGKRRIHGTDWQYRTHGIGVEISKSGNKGGIDFDFDKLEPDQWRLREFMIKQLNDGTLLKKIYRPLMQDENRFSLAFEKAVNKRS